MLLILYISNLSKGFSILLNPFVVICVYISVVLLLEWPNKLWIYLKSVPFSPSNNHSLGLYSLKYFRKTTKVFLGSKVYRSFFPLLCCIFIPFERDVRYATICIRSLSMSFIQINRFIAIHLYPNLQGYLWCNLIYVYTIVQCEWCVRGNFVAIIFYLLLANYYFLPHVCILRWLWIFRWGNPLWWVFGWGNPLWLPFFNIILVDGWGIVFILVDHEGRPYVIRSILVDGWGLPLWDSFQSMC